jgi:hypothetical protein
MSTIDERVVPRPRGDGHTVIEPPEPGPGHWAGGPSAVATDDGIYLAYRLRRPVDAGRGYAIVVARSDDGLAFTPLATFTKESFATASFERPALVQRPDGGWRLYVSCSTPNSFHWWVDAVDAPTPDAFSAYDRVSVWPGDEHLACKDPVVMCGDRGWEAWVCCHPLDDHANTDRMYSRYATSPDGLEWAWGPIALEPRPGMWDGRGARLAAVFETSTGRVAYYDGRASSAENWSERTGVAVETADGTFAAIGDTPAAESPDGTGALRYVSVVPVDSQLRMYYEACRADGAHEIRTELLGY